ncbi:AraC family transcriptional regulator [Pontibacillus halophilus JSM 076056 = DSM 19796]|uniref:AraC family transcriptional regulator n=1 Tax=Pontibacillus halophilus JSM 076056 = DSM 19796 TaxID=1385510 RepID=A0A0A5GRN6_9BACI|nr:AraC family transcriptional regulator [Pontibacillus halophilus]KGX93830.1 AraC family transcriptional regulator [Pontibacillus halophilus JSM 076056 = DSM 19796]
MSTSVNEKPLLNQFRRLQQDNQKNGFLHPSYLLEKQLLIAISEGDEKKGRMILDTIHQDKRPWLAGDPVRSLKNSLIASCTLFTRALIKGGIDPEVAFNLSDAYILHIEKLDDTSLLETLEYDMLRDFILVLKEEDQLKYSKIVNRAISYINEHLIDDLSLEVIAHHSFVSPSYLSHLFKKEAGISIIQFINQKRIEESKYFLLHTETPISEISTMFQFCNQSYFTSLFKKYTGVTPKEFREDLEKPNKKSLYLLQAFFVWLFERASRLQIYESFERSFTFYIQSVLVCFINGYKVNIGNQLGKEVMSWNA